MLPRPRDQVRGADLPLQLLGPQHGLPQGLLQPGYLHTTQWLRLQTGCASDSAQTAGPPHSHTHVGCEPHRSGRGRGQGPGQVRQAGSSVRTTHRAGRAVTRPLADLCAGLLRGQPGRVEGDGRRHHHPAASPGGMPPSHLHAAQSWQGHRTSACGFHTRRCGHRICGFKARSFTIPTPYFFKTAFIKNKRSRPWLLWLSG